jgi:Tol biopolymer transport system component
MKYNFLLSALFVFFIIVSGCRKEDPIIPPTGYYPRQLTQDNLDYRAFLSPDGKYIAFYSMRYTFKPEESGINFELWLMSSDGFDQWRLILPNSIFPETKPTFLYWDADSKSMIVQIDDGFYGNYSKSEIWRIGVDGKKTQLYTPNLRLENVTYSPDRKKLAYIIQGPSPDSNYPIYKLYIANVDFTDSVRIEKGLISDYVWQADSKGLIFSLYDRPNENFDLWKSKIDGTGKLRFSETPASEVSLQCSTDGKYLAYSMDNSIYITILDNLSPKMILSSATNPEWIPNRNLLWVTNVNTDGNTSSWGEKLFIDKEGTVIKRFSERTLGFSFSSTGKYFVYTLDADIWMDYMP